MRSNIGFSFYHIKFLTKLRLELEKINKYTLVALLLGQKKIYIY